MRQTFKASSSLENLRGLHGSRVVDVSAVEKLEHRLSRDKVFKHDSISDSTWFNKFQYPPTPRHKLEGGGEWEGHADSKAWPSWIEKAHGVSRCHLMLSLHQPRTHPPGLRTTLGLESSCCLCVSHAWPTGATCIRSTTSTIHAFALFSRFPRCSRSTAEAAPIRGLNPATLLLFRMRWILLGFCCRMRAQRCLMGPLSPIQPRPKRSAALGGSPSA